MMFMNEWDIRETARRYAAHPALGPATTFLLEFMEEVNAHSDGWPYWSPPVRSAAKLMALINTRDPRLVTPAHVRRALGPIKSFMTRRGTGAGMTLPTLRS
jgi:hypothetical protein